jgi:GTP-binding protein
MGIVVAIDGPSGAGKSSTAKLIAHRAGWNYLDTGALYRGITWLSLEKNEQDPQKLLQLLKTFPLKLGPFNAKYKSPCWSFLVSVTTEGCAA